MNGELLIRYISGIVSLTAEESSIILQYFRTRKYLKGQYVVQQGDICNCESFVVNGCLRTFYVDDEGVEHTVAFSIENWWAADLGSFLSRTPAFYNVQCLEAVELLQITHDDLEQLYQHVPKMERFFRIIIQRAYVASERRIVRNFSMDAKARFQAFREHYPQIEQRVPQYMIASYLGITKEFLSKIRSQLVGQQD